MRIPLRLLVLLLLLAEIAVLILVGQAIGVAGTLALVLLSMVAGLALLRWQGTATLMRIRAEAAGGRVPARPLLEGAVLAIAALLLIVPGFLTDMIGLLLFIPAVRQRLGPRMRGRFEAKRRAWQPPGPQPRPATIELDSSEYSSGPDRSSPWRRGEGE